MADMINYEDALRLVTEAAAPLAAVKTPLSGALGLVLAQDMYAVQDIPPFVRSPLDGFAFCSAATAKAKTGSPVALGVVGRITAGMTLTEAGIDGPLCETGAVRIFTGAMLPPGADAVAAQEKVVYNDGMILLDRPYLAGENVIYPGEDVVRGQLMFPAGCMLGAAEFGMMGSQGMTHVATHGRPRVAILTTGSELAEAGEILRTGQIYNSNRYLLEALVSKAGGEPVYVGKVPDELEKLKEAILSAAATADIVLTTGGVSVGDHDLIPAAVNATGAKLLFHRVAMRPGTPVLAACLDSALLFGFSGNPAACLVAFLQFALPAISIMRGLSGWRQQWTEATLVGTASVVGISGQVRFLAARTSLEKDGFVTRPQARQKPGVLSYFHSTNSLVVLPAGSGPLAPGARVSVQLFPTIFAETPFVAENAHKSTRNLQSRD